jgi:hypothetical protein
MNEAISRIVKNAFYPTVNYIPANDEIGSHTLDEYLTIFKESIEKENPQSSTSKKIFNPKHPVILINTEKDIDATEGVEAVDIQTESRFNVREAKIIGQIITEFLQQYNKKSQIELAKQIGIISPYRHQNNLIYGELRANNLSSEVIENIRVDTVDRYQGDEREIIIISLTNSNEANIIGQLHREWRRMNVSISRAKAKLVLLGNKKTFINKSDDPKEDEAKDLFKQVFKTIDQLEKEGFAIQLASEKEFK